VADGGTEWGLQQWQVLTSALTFGFRYSYSKETPLCVAKKNTFLRLILDELLQSSGSTIIIQASAAIKAIQKSLWFHNHCISHRQYILLHGSLGVFQLPRSQTTAIHFAFSVSQRKKCM